MTTDNPTRPEIRGHFGVVASTHWLASQAAMAMLERGGNAFDAACAGGFVLQVAEPHLNGPGGDVPIICYRGDTGETSVICGQGPAPGGANIGVFRDLGLDIIPGTGLLPAVVPGAFDAWMRMLQDHGTLSLREVLEPAISYARRGIPVLPRLAATLNALERVFRRDWPTSAALYLAAGMPEAGDLLRNESLAGTWRRLIDEAEAGGGGREKVIGAARDIWYEGFIADAIDAFCRETSVMDISGGVHGALLRGEDMAAWRATVEPAVSLDLDEYQILKCGPWSQGPVLLQCLAMLREEDLAGLVREDVEFVHRLTEVSKLAFADRESFYGDPDFVDVPLEHLLSVGYARARHGEIGDRASGAFRPGNIRGFGHPPDFAAACERHKQAGILGSYGAGEPTMSRDYADVTRGDTCYICVTDRHGNMVSATPSGGWLQSSPIIPDLGFCLGTRAQVFWLDPDAPNSLQPGKRPRTTLTPSLVLRGGVGYLACGTPGGDQQDQWQLQFLLRHLYGGHDLQSAIDAPAFHAEQWPSSFYPRQATSQRLVMEPRFGQETLDALRRRGHQAEFVPDWSEGRMGACRNDAGDLFAAASPRGRQAYAVGR